MRTDKVKFGGPHNEGETWTLCYKFEKPILFCAFMIETGNDFPERDPKNFTVSYTN